MQMPFNDYSEPYEPLRKWLDSLNAKDLKKLPPFRSGAGIVKDFPRWVRYLKANGKTDTAAMVRTGAWILRVEELQAHIEKHKPKGQKPNGLSITI
jgi:hypothetical protein